MRLYVYLLAFHDLISGLEHRRVLHFDAFCHFYHFLQQFCAIPKKNKKGHVSVDQAIAKIMQNTVGFSDT